MNVLSQKICVVEEVHKLYSFPEIVPNNSFHARRMALQKEAVDLLSPDESIFLILKI